MSYDDKIEKVIYGLKDFQKQTVDRVFDIFVNEEKNRVLVADEVGLGKTLIAKGIIAKLANENLNNKDKSLQVVYICSNSSIASQNLRKLSIFDDDVMESQSDSRLTMLSLKDINKESKNKFNIKFIPLTPGTSFDMKSSGGTKEERLLIYVLLRKVTKLKNYFGEIKDIFKMRAGDSWYRDADENGCLFKSIDKKVNKNVLIAFKEFVENNEELLLEIKSLCKNRKRGKVDKVKERNLVGKLRIKIVELSMDILSPDLVIMDEFQRFNNLINDSDIDNEFSGVNIIAKRFFNRKDLRILLLSATPYKLYSTSEELEQGEDHFKEFEDVIKFLIYDNKSLNTFKEIWKEYTYSINNLDKVDFEVAKETKIKVENFLRNYICRTERLVVSESGNALINTNKVKNVEVQSGDIEKYIQCDRISERIQELEKRCNSPMEYYKSVPFMYSFMEHYKLKKVMNKYIKKDKELRSLVRKNNDLWLKKEDVEKYNELDYANGKFREVVKEVFDKNGDMLLWIPPSKPYYELEGPFKGSKEFSKTLVFSHWEMVPRMMAALLSYEAERRTVGQLVNKGDERKLYFEKFLKGRLNFRTIESNKKSNSDRPPNMSNLILLYPNITLSSFFDEVYYLNNPKSLEEIREWLRIKIESEIDKIRCYQSRESVMEDKGWYFTAALLIDKFNKEIDIEEIVKCINYNATISRIDKSDSRNINGKKSESKAFKEHIRYITEGVINPEKFNLGKIPKDLSSTLVDILLGSPANNIYRAFIALDKDNSIEYKVSCVESFFVAEKFLNKFNSQEAISILDITYGKKDGERLEYWKKVLMYCRDGNLQAVLEEYIYLIVENFNIDNKNVNDKMRRVSKEILNKLNLRTGSLKVDTYKAFVKSEDDKEEKLKFNMRTHYSVNFAKQIDNKTETSIENVRNLFNSPFRPFVLSTTSIGQEGLDFHWYCRKILHWNLPSNPVELEQREGRINRYKGLVIRQNISKKYGKIHFKKEDDLWDRLFEECRINEKGNHCDIIPYWQLREDNEEDNVNIERIIYQYPYSKEVNHLERLLKILSVYRLTLGQARQEDVVNNIIQNSNEDMQDRLKELLLNLSPYYYK